MKYRFFGLFIASLSLYGGESSDEEQSNVNTLMPPVAAPRNCPCESVGVYVTGEALLFQAEQSGLEYSVLIPSATNTTVGPGAFPVVIGSDTIPNQHWKWGFLVGLGYHSDYDAWDIDLNYTYFHNSYTNSVTISSGGGLNAIDSAVIGASSTSAVNAANSTFNLKLDVIDLDLMRDFFVSQKIIFEPHLGLRNAWVREMQTTNYVGGASLGNFSPDQVKLMNNFWGLGIRGGLNSQWNFHYGFSLFGNSAFSLLTGQYYNLSVTETVNAGTVTAQSIKDNYDVSKFLTDLQLGLRWDYIFNDLVHLGIQVAWEQHFFSNQWQWQSSATAPTPNGDLTLAGVSFALRLDF